VPRRSPHERVGALLDPPVARPPTTDGYVDALVGAGGRVASTASARPSLAQRAMRTTLVPQIYERAWRPLLFGLWTWRSTAREQRLLLDLLHPEPGALVLDVACGPGNTTRRLREGTRGGFVVGVDVAAPMLARAVRDTEGDGIAYVRGDAHALPFADGTFDVVACFGALYLVEEPFRVIDELVRVLKPGGRAAVLATCARGPAPLRAAAGLARPLTGLRTFGPAELTEAFRDRGLTDVDRVVSGWSQTVFGRRPG
jgi:ubiquinone/menaquinone biosynthesis C-methylase UbiE